MKFDLGSDLHLCFDEGNSRVLKLFPEQRSKTLILAGDIAEIAELKLKRSRHKTLFIEFFTYCSEMYENVVYVFGNHEFYGAELNYAVQNARDIFKNLSLTNIHILDNQTLDVGDALIFGGTMWTSFRGGNPMALNDAVRSMQDYEYIYWIDQYKERSKILPEMILSTHRTTLRAIEKFSRIATNKPKIVVTHHAPHYQSIPPYYRNSRINYLYYEELFDLIEPSDIAIWCHGHTHNSAEYTIGNTKVVANPRGYYGHETDAYNWRIKTVDTADCVNI